MSNPLMAMFGMNGQSNEPTISPELTKRLKKHHLNSPQFLDYLQRYREEAYVIAHPCLGRVIGAQFTGGKLYPVDAIRYDDAGTAIEVAITDNQGLRYTEKVHLVDTRVEVTADLPKVSKLILVLGEMRDLLEEKWAKEMTRSCDLLKKRYDEYKDVKSFDVGDLVTYKDDMVVAGPLHRRGTAIVVEKLSRYGADVKRCSKTHEVQDLLIAVFDNDSDFAVMPIASDRLRKVTIEQVGSFKNPFAMKKPTTEMLVEEDSAATETSES